MKGKALLWLSAGLVLAFATAAIVGMPMVHLEAIREGGPQVIPLLLAAGVADGLNPCAFSTLLVFLGALLAYVGQRLADPDGVTTVRRTALWVGLAYAAGIFGVYFLAGLGLFGVGRLIPPSAVPWVIRSSGVVVILMGLIMVQEYLIPGTRLRLGMPRAWHPRVRELTRATTIGGAVVAGGLIGLCSVPCSGAVYLGVISLLSLYGWMKGMGLLLLYNLAFILPILALLITITSRQPLLQFTHWYLRYRSLTKLVLGVFVILLGFLVLYVA